MTFGLRIRVDFNRRTGDGSVIGSMRRATGAISVGDVVVATQPGEDMERFARVISIDDANGRVELEVNWDSNPSEWAPAVREADSGTTDLQFVPNSPLYRVSEVGTTASFASGGRLSQQSVNA